jgi:hypothetical protein
MLRGDVSLCPIEIEVILSENMWDEIFVIDYFDRGTEVFEINLLHSELVLTDRILPKSMVRIQQGGYGRYLSYGSGN